MSETPVTLRSDVVVMFVLALTILGLSLFSLSSYEAQFFTRSVQTAQATQL